MSSKDGSYVPVVPPKKGSPNKRKSERLIPRTEVTTNAQPMNMQKETNADDEHILFSY